jgi:flagellar hook-associated protein 3 FlgL
MRVTQNILDRNVLYSLQENLERLGKLNEQLSTGQRINTMSDDVPGANQVLRLQRENQRMSVYLKNVDTVDRMLSFATSTLQTVSETVTQIKQLAVQAATETYTSEQRSVMAESVDAMLSTLVSMANVSNQGTYVFGGEGMDAAPYAVTTDASGSITAVTYRGQALNTQVVIGPDVHVDVNLVGADVFQRTGDLFETVIGLRDAMRADDRDEINRQIGELDTSHTDVSQALGRLGARQSQLQVSRNSLERLSALNLQTISDRQDADISEVAVRYNSLMALLEMVMKVAAESVQPSIVSFL